MGCTCGTPVRAEKTDGVELCGSKAKRTHDDRCSRRYGLRTRARRESLSARLLAREWLPLLVTPLCNGAYATAASAVAADASWHKLEASQVEVGLPGAVRAACACLSPPGALHGLPCRVTPLRAAAREPVRLASRAAVALRLASHRQRGRPPPCSFRPAWGGSRVDLGAAPTAGDWESVWGAVSGAVFLLRISVAGSAPAGSAPGSVELLVRSPGGPKPDPSRASDEAWPKARLDSCSSDGPSAIAPETSTGRAPPPAGMPCRATGPPPTRPPGRARGVPGAPRAGPS